MAHLHYFPDLSHKYAAHCTLYADLIVGIHFNLIFFYCCNIIYYREDIITISKKKGTNFKEDIMSKLCGSTVITRYNNKTYRIDDIDFSITPLSTFNHNGTDVSF